ncbi:hypothetical protein DDB_G0292916 [Dictyostelium discoideum AX4]|uniref:Uncharacterized protein n=1 Tax=Dictyostelium discoideum TaxID=44689 RepID=Q54CH5_DICDI|nr:hypothetical protein DDB_G0292916 [Dictyostelium discoideum AX4]EAL61007.1 hypothetical protein DDB_G0292916 [Dictyostelium discoideum AX4]|eukprot:XP_629441.1 hypothetical protein DDB_G0292916 [Dictyostelium discoideum AX4]
MSSDSNKSYLLYFLNSNDIKILNLDNLLDNQANNKNRQLVTMNEILEEQLSFNKRQFQKYTQFMKELLEIENKKARIMDILSRSLIKSMENTNDQLNNIRNQINQTKQ